MKNIGFLLAIPIFFAGAILADSAHAASYFNGTARCYAPSAPRVVVEAIPFTAVLNHSSTIKELSSISPSRQNSLGIGVTYTQGLVVAQLSSTSDYGMTSEQLPDGSWCSRADTVKVMFGAPTPATVHVASEYPKGSCAYAAVLEHEMKHVAMYHKVIADVQPWLRQNVPNAASTVAAAAGTSMKASQDALVAGMKKNIDPLIAYVHSYAEIWSNSVDTPEEYARVHSLCSEWYLDSIERTIR